MSDDWEGGGLAVAVAGLRRVVACFEPGSLDGEAAVRALELFGEMERLAAAGKALAARRVEETRVWQRRGVRSAAHLVASMWFVGPLGQWRPSKPPGVWMSDRPPPRRCDRGSCRRPRRVRSPPRPGTGPTWRRRWWLPPGRSRCRRCKSAVGRCRRKEPKPWPPTGGSATAATCATGPTGREHCASRPGCVPTTGPRCWPPSRPTGRRLCRCPRRWTEERSGLRGRRPGGDGRRRWERRAEEGAGGHGPRPDRPRRAGAGSHRRR